MSQSAILNLPRKSFAAAIVTVVALVALLSVPVLEAAPASAATSASSKVLKSLNASRVAGSSAAYLRNSSIDKYAQQYAVKYAKCGKSCVDLGKVDATPPSGWVSLDVSLQHVTGGTASARPEKVATLLRTKAASLVFGDYNYGAVGWVTKGTTAFAIFVTMKYSPAIMTPGVASIVGTAKVGTTLKAKTTAFHPAADSYTYLWKSNGGNASTASTYTPSSVQLGQKITLTITGHRAGFTTVSSTTHSTKAVVKGTFSPRPVSVGNIFGVGQNLGWTSGIWTPDPATWTKQWLRNGVPIVGQTGNNYVPTAADVGKRIDIRVTASSPGFVSATRTSSSKGVVKKVFGSTAQPQLAGFPSVGNVVTVSNGSWSIPSTTYTYQWFRYDVLIPGATTHAHKLSAADEAMGSIWCAVTAHRAGYLPATANSTTLYFP